MGKKFLSLATVYFLVSSFFITPAEAAPAAPTEPNVSMCTGSGVIAGTDGNDVLTGTAGADVICGLGGDDEINGLNGDDIIIGGLGNDTIGGGEGNDSLVGSEGDDELHGGLGQDGVFGDSGLDDLFGESEADYISGGPGADNLFGGDAADSLLAGEGNDGLDGGLGADYVNGEAGSNTCMVESQDTKISCFYDTHAPQLVSIAVDPESREVDSSTEAKHVTVRAVIADPGAGVDFGSNSMFSMRFDSATDLRIGSPDTSAWAECTYVALVKGNLNRGVFEFDCLVPLVARKETYYLAVVGLRDKVGNRSAKYFKALKEAKLAVSFKQIGNTDRTKPKFKSFEIVGTRNLNSIEDKVIGRIGFSDSGNGLGYFELDYTSSADGWMGFIRPPENPMFSLEMPLCSSLSSIDRSCLSSGTLREGTIDFPITLNPSRDPNFTELVSASTMTISQVFLRDQNGNELQLSNLSGVQKSKSKFYKKFVTPRQGGSDDDHSKPKIISYSVSTTHIDTGSSDQVISFKIRATDKGVGFDLTGCPAGAGLESLTYQDNNDAITFRCVGVTGTAFDSTSEYEITIPAHFPRGDLLISLGVQDASWNHNNSGMSWEYLKSKKKVWRITNG
jgi:hypothetical protein